MIQTYIQTTYAYKWLWKCTKTTVQHDSLIWHFIVFISCSQNLDPIRALGLRWEPCRCEASWQPSSDVCRAQATGKFPLQTRDPCDHDKRDTRHANTTWRLHHERKIRENLHTFILIYIQQAKGKTLYTWKCLEAPWLVHIQLKEFGMMAHTSTSSYFYQSPSRFFLLHVPFLIPTPNPKYFQQRSHCHTSRILCLQELWSSTGDLGQLQLRFRLQFDSKGNANRVQ